ncbi:restriction endonuclease subunit S [Edwardsiella tarda]|uniref:restriction endonuclease subunit S n=1 Tax=Edwardsiella tarda TaxID=636 RepID=UPI00266E9E5A|nr:restriction endonuclease subunit S [Edwardsiella tarda]WKS82438.1 restriction endonuclease subunit S [Edwardsiella tarda]
MVPKGWSESYLSEVVTYKKGYAFNSSLYAEEGIRIVRISDTTRDSIHSDNPVFIAGGNVEGLEQYSLFENDIILSTVGSRPHLLDSMVGKAVKVPRSAHNSLLNQNLVKLIPKKTKITNEYLFSMLKKKEFIQFISNLVRGNANQVSITLADLFKYKFILPSLPEQKKIAQILSAWDKAISVTENLLANSQQQKKALMQQLLTGKKRLLDENGVRFNGEWRSGPLGSLVGRIYGGGTPSRANSGLWGGDIPWVTVKDLISPHISSAQEYINEIGLAESASNLVLAGTVIIATRMAVGKTVMASCDVAINQDLKAICASENVCSEYIFNWFLSHSEQIAKMGTGSTVKGVQVEAIKALTMTIPKAIEEQQKIADVLSTADAEISALEKKLACLKDEKKALMQQLLTGKRRVKVDAEEAVSA